MGRKKSKPAATNAGASQEPSTCRWWVAGLSAALGALLGAGAFYLPWRTFTAFGVFTSALALSHLLTAALVLFGHPRWTSAWRAHAFVALAWLGYLGWVVVSSAAHIAGLYGSLGNGLAAALAAAYAPAVLLSLPTALWAIAATGGLRGRAALSTSALVLLVVVLDPARHYVRGLGEAHATASEEREFLRALEEAAPTLTASSTVTPARLAVPGAARCERSPADRPTAILQLRSGERTEQRCLQAADAAALREEVQAALRAPEHRAPAVVEWVTRTRPLRPHTPLVASFVVRPGLDGVCLGDQCLASWALIALDEFNAYTPVDFIQDLRLGVDPARLRRHFGEEGSSFEGLLAIETRSFVVQDGRVRTLRRLRGERPTLGPETVGAALEGARRFLLGAQAEDGRFMYLVNPFTGEVSYQGFSVPRQAGTTLALCEVGGGGPEVDRVVARSLAMLETLLVRRGELGALIYPPGAPVREASLGPAALSLIAFLACRDRVGPKHDELIGRIGRFLLAVERLDGSFRPRFDLQDELPVEGSQVLYAAGQAIFALVLLEKLAATVSHPSFPEPSALRDGVDRAMGYIAGQYWDMPIRDFFFIEENWNCLAARAALGHHRHDAYERFCVDYARFKLRYMFREQDSVDRDYVGAYSFANVTVPYNTPTAGFAEAAAAAVEVARARGEAVADLERALAGAMSYLLFAQWSEPDCFACTTQVQIPGAFSESLSSPVIRIDYVQHAMAGLGHGARALGIVAR